MVAECLGEASMSAARPCLGPHMHHILEHLKGQTNTYELLSFCKHTGDLFRKEGYSTCTSFITVTLKVYPRKLGIPDLCQPVRLGAGDPNSVKLTPTKGTCLYGLNPHEWEWEWSSG